MTVRRSTFEADLERVLAMRTDPAVSPDLARRIVVRTIQLPQAAGGRDRAVSDLSARLGAAPVGRFLRASLPLGGALAASIAVLLSGQATPDLPSALASRQTNPVEPVAAETFARAADVAPTSSNSPAAKSPRMVLAAAAPPGMAPGRAESSAAREAPETQLAIAPAEVDSPAPVLVGYDDLAKERPAVRGFVLAGNAAAPPPPPPVYGPVLEPDEMQPQRSLGAWSSSMGMAIASSPPRGPR